MQGRDRAARACSPLSDARVLCGKRLWGSRAPRSIAPLCTGPGAPCRPCAAPAPPPPSSFPMPARLRSVRSPPGPARARVGARCPETAPGESGGPAAQTRSPAPQRASVRGPRRMSADAVEGRRLAAHCDRLLRATAGPAGPGTPATARLQSGHRGATRRAAWLETCTAVPVRGRSVEQGGAQLHVSRTRPRRTGGGTAPIEGHRRCGTCAHSRASTHAVPPAEARGKWRTPRFHTVWPPGHATRVRATRRHGRSFQRASQRGSDLPLSAGPVSKSQQELKHR